MTRRRHIVGLSLAFTSTAVLLVLVARPLGALPALAPLLNLSTGIWNHSAPQPRTQSLSGLKATVRVAIDAHGVPHIFAENDYDLYLAQGFVTAQFRLFQMDLTTRVAQGRLSELVGEKGLEWDRYFVKFGMREYVDSTWERMRSDPRRAEAVEAFVAGVNLWISQLDSRTVPPEYKLLGLWPEKFSSRRVASLLILMAYNLTGRSFDLEATQFRKKASLEKALDLWPEKMPEHLESFVVPNPQAQGRVPGISKHAEYEAHVQDFPTTFQPAEGNGSNNFAVGPKKSETGASIVANDTHLSFSLPNVWFETQLITPDKNTYGVTFPMAPGVVLGFTPEVAWAVTNGTTDVLDWFEVEFRDETSWDYKWGEDWVRASPERATVEVKNGSPQTVEVVKTGAGFLMKREGRWGLVAKWVGFRMGEEVSAVLDLNRAKNFADCAKALDHWFVPVQNWICADAQNIGIFHRGWIPVRESGEGQFVQAATPRAWSENIAFPELPQLINPTEGFVQSANQRVVPTSYRYFMGWDYEDPVRAQVIRRKLESREKFNSQDLMDLQNDSFEIHAEQALPLLLKHLSMSELSPDQTGMKLRLEKWSHQAEAQGVETLFFKTWWTELRKSILADDWREIDSSPRLPRTRLQWLLERLDQNSQDSDQHWVDDHTTEKSETLGDQVTRSFLKAWEELGKEYGGNPNHWKWSHESPVFPHLLKLPGFGMGPIVSDGSGQTVRANRKVHGPTYKLVVQLGSSLKAWSMVPGGASGDPFDPQYGRFLSEWAEGKMKEVYFWRSWEEARSQATTIFELQPPGGTP